MSTVTPKLNLTKPAAVEQFSLPLLNGNFDKIDLGAVTITKALSTFNSATADFRPSEFIRFSIGNQGIIVARIAALFKDGYTVNVPSNTSTAIGFNDDIIPLNMRNKAPVGIMQGPVFHSEGRGDNLQAQITDGIVYIRSTGAAFTRSSAGSMVMRWNVAYEWDGVS